MVDLRIGSGFDIHQFGDEEKPLVLAGIVFTGTGVLSHSDGDVVIHACIDSLLGPLSLGDIGQNYPDTDAKWAGVSSMELLADTLTKVAATGWHVVNIDCTYVGDSPKIAPSVAKMNAALSEAVGAPVTVKGKTTEQSPGFVGYAACYATALLEKNG